MPTHKKSSISTARDRYTRTISAEEAILDEVRAQHPEPKSGNRDVWVAWVERHEKACAASGLYAAESERRAAAVNFITAVRDALRPGPSWNSDLEAMFASALGKGRVMNLTTQRKVLDLCLKNLT